MVATRTGEVSWQQLALLDGILSAAPPGSPRRPAPKIKPVRLTAEPPALAALVKASSNERQELVAKVSDLILWPGKPGVEPEKAVKPLTAEEQKRFEQGKELY